MKSPHMKSKIAASVSKYLIQQTDKEGQEGAHEHLEYFFHSMPDLNALTKKTPPPSTLSFLPAPKFNQSRKETTEPPISFTQNTVSSQVRLYKSYRKNEKDNSKFCLIFMNRFLWFFKIAKQTTATPQFANIYSKSFCTLQFTIKE